MLAKSRSKRSRDEEGDDAGDQAGPASAHGAGDDLGDGLGIPCIDTPDRPAAGGKARPAVSAEQLHAEVVAKIAFVLGAGAA